MTVEEALRLPSLSGGSVIAGANGLDHEITSAMVLEAVDIENWGKRGQLIITSFYAFEHLKSAQLALTFRTMSAIGISAVAFKPERLVAEAPSSIVELCNDFDLPLIKLSPQVKYESILLDVLGHVLDSNLTLLNRFFDMHRRTMALALQQPSIPSILQTTKNLVHFDVSYLDTERDRRLGTDAGLCSFSAWSFIRRDPSAYQTHAYFDARLRYDDAKTLADTSTPSAKAPTDEDAQAYGQRGSSQALAVRIPSSDNVDYYLIIHNGNSTLTQLDIMAVENIVSLLQMEILKQNALKQKAFWQNNNTVHDLLLGRFGSRERIDAALTQLGMDRHPHYQALLIRARMAEAIDADRQDELLRALRRQILASYPKLVYFLNGDRLVFLGNFSRTNPGIDLDKVRACLERVHKNSTLPLFTHLAVLSETAGRYELPSINDEVVKAYRLFDSAKQSNLTVRFDDLGVYKLLLQANDQMQLQSCLDPRVSLLARKHSDLFDTLVTFCANGLNYPQTAEELFIHPKTVRYRIDRAREICGIDVRNPDDYLQVMLAERIFSLGIGPLEPNRADM